jgi:hypothetical protein
VLRDRQVDHYQGLSWSCVTVIDLDKAKKVIESACGLPALLVKEAEADEVLVASDVE